MADCKVRVGLAGDDEAHRILLEKLADHALGGDRLERRDFVGSRHGHRYLSTIKHVAAKQPPSGRKLYRSSRIEGEAAGYALTLIAAAQDFRDRAEAVLVLVDEDGKASRAHDARLAAKTLTDRGLPTIAGVCNPCAEGWLVALIGPSRPVRLRALETALGKKVGSRPEQLCNQPSAAKHHAKRALRFLVDDADREVSKYSAETQKFHETSPHLDVADLSALQLHHLTGCGLADFWAGLQSVYLPRFAS